MPAPKGNDFWSRRLNHGRRGKFDYPERLWCAAVDYFEWNEANPIQSRAMVKQDSRSKLTNVLKPRPMTIGGLCAHLGVSEITWRRWRRQSDFADTVDRIEGIIRLQKFELAAAGELDGRIISRDLGLADKKVIAAAERDADLEKFTAACEAMSEDQLLALDFLLKSEPGGKYTPPTPEPKLLEHKRPEKPPH